MSFRVFRLFFVCCVFWICQTGGASAQEPTPTGSLFPNRFTGRQIIVALGSDADRPEYRLLDNGLMFYRKGSEGSFTQLGQQRKDSTMRTFARLEQECRIKTTRLEKPEKPDVTVTWKRAKTEFSVDWEKRKGPEVYEQFYERFMELFPRLRKK